MGEAGYDTAQICLNGHIINAISVYKPEYNKEFCDVCGSATITCCQVCKEPIRGYYHRPHVILTYPINYVVPSYCQNCGNAFPWTEARIQAAKELADELEHLSEQEKDSLKDAVDDIVRDTPQSTVAATRFKRLIIKAGQEASDAFRQILVDITSEAIKKSIWG